MAKKKDRVIIVFKTKDSEMRIPGEWELLLKNSNNICTLKKVGGNCVRAIHESNLRKI